MVGSLDVGVLNPSINQKEGPRILSEEVQVGKLLERQRLEPGKIEVLNSKLNFHPAKPIRLQITDQLN